MFTWKRMVAVESEKNGVLRYFFEVKTMKLADEKNLGKEESKE